MESFDAILKRLIQQFGERTLERLTGTRIARWIPTELPKVQNLRVDLLGGTERGGLAQIEVQSTAELVTGREVFVSEHRRRTLQIAS
jgi:hypothetical protein